MWGMVVGKGLSMPYLCKGLLGHWYVIVCFRRPCAWCLFESCLLAACLTIPVLSKRATTQNAHARHAGVGGLALV